MKKIISLALSALLTLSMSVPAFAANTVTSTESGSNTATQSVKASYTPSSGTTAEITGVSITIDGTEYTSANTSAESPAKITPTSTVTLTVTGNNFDKLPNAHGDYAVWHTIGRSEPVFNGVNWTITGNTATRTLSASDFSSCTRAFQILYTNKYNEDDWTDTGIYIIYDSGISDADKAVISGISVKVGGTTYTSGTVTLTPTSDDVTIIVTGTNLNNATNDNQVEYIKDHAVSMAAGLPWTVNEAGTEASYVLELRDFASCTTAFEIQYSNDDSTYIGSGVYVIYDSGISDADKAVISGISVKVGGTTYTSGQTVTLTPTSGDVTITVTGTNLDKGSSQVYVKYASSNTTSDIDKWTWTISQDGKTATRTYPLGNFSGTTTALEIEYSNDKQSTWTGSGIYIIYQAETVSVEVTWGSLSFTYSDEQVSGSEVGWTCDTGANTVKVENKGTVAVKADVTFTKSTTATNITNVTGTFDKSTATLAKDASETFTLTLAGKPDGALSDTEIGTITVTITKAGN